MNARNIDCAHIGCLHICVFVHAFARTIGRAYECLLVLVLVARNICCVCSHGLHKCVFVHVFARILGFAYKCFLVQVVVRYICCV